MRLNLLGLLRIYVHLAAAALTARLVLGFRIAMRVCSPRAAALPRLIGFAQHFQARRANARVLGGGGGSRWVPAFGRTLAVASLVGLLLAAGASGAVPDVALVGVGLGINYKVEPLGTFNFQAAPDRRDLLRNVYLQKLACRLNATVDIAAGGGADGTLLSEHLGRLLDVRVVWDNIEIVPRTPAYIWMAMTKRNDARQAPRYAGLANAGIQTTAVEAYFEIPFSRGWLVNPFETVLPPLPVGQQFQLEVYWAQDVNAGAGSAAGSGALVVGGTRVITFTAAPTLRVDQYFAPQGALPIYLPMYSYFVGSAGQLNAANANYSHDIKTSRRFDAMLVRYGSNAQNRLQNGINNFSIISAQERHVNARTYLSHHYDHAKSFPAVANAGADDLGYLFWLAADGGKLTNAVDPREIQQLQLLLDLAAPSVNPGEIRVLHSELVKMDNLTR